MKLNMYLENKGAVNTERGYFRYRSQRRKLNPIDGRMVSFGPSNAKFSAGVKPLVNIKLKAFFQ